MRMWQDSLKGVLLSRQERGGPCLVNSIFKLLFAAVSYWGLELEWRVEVAGGAMG